MIAPPSTWNITLDESTLATKPKFTAASLGEMTSRGFYVDEDYYDDVEGHDEDESDFTIETVNNTIVVLIKFKDCKTFLYACAVKATNGNYQIKYLRPRQGITQLLFQNDLDYREGFTSSFVFNGETRFEYEGATPFIIQGIQMNAAYFFYSDNRELIYFKNVYLKDWVITLTGSDYSILSGNVITSFEECLVSMHIRTTSSIEYKSFDEGWDGSGWTKTARYIEYSKIEDTAPDLTLTLFQAATTNCTTIIRNIRARLSRGSSNNYIFVNSTTSSWDIEFAYVDRKDYSPLMVGGVISCFISIRAREIAPSITYEELTSIFPTIISGVNIWNFDPLMKDDGQGGLTPCTNSSDIPVVPEGGTITIGHSGNNYIKDLTTSQCQDPAEMSKWGFFVNTIDDD